MTTPKIDPNGMAVCLDSHVGPDGITYRQGDRVRASHLDVKKHPLLYAPEGLDTEELHALRMARFGFHG
jgi:hypothetical protein